MKRRAKTSTFFRDRICLPVAQAYHRWDTNVRMTSLGLSKPVKGTIKPLNETLAVDLGAEMIGEMTTFLIGFAVLYLEYWRQSRNAEEKQQQDQMAGIKMNLQADRKTATRPNGRDKD